MATVMGPTPPGTGVMKAACSLAVAKWTSPTTRFPFDLVLSVRRFKHTQPQTWEKHSTAVLMVGNVYKIKSYCALLDSAVFCHFLKIFPLVSPCSHWLPHQTTATTQDGWRLTCAYCDTRIQASHLFRNVADDATSQLSWTHTEEKCYLPSLSYRSSHTSMIGCLVSLWLTGNKIDILPIQRDARPQVVVALSGF